MTRDLQAIRKRVVERNEAEQQLAQRRAAAAVDEDELAADLAADLNDDPASKEAELKAMQQQVEDTLLEDAEAVGTEPPSHVTAIHPTQVRQLCLTATLVRVAAARLRLHGAAGFMRCGAGIAAMLILVFVVSEMSC
jgi:uncharacterized membrane protein YqiK